MPVKGRCWSTEQVGGALASLTICFHLAVLVSLFQLLNQHRSKSFGHYSDSSNMVCNDLFTTFLFRDHCLQFTIQLDMEKVKLFGFLGFCGSSGSKDTDPSVISVLGLPSCADLGPDLGPSLSVKQE